MASPASRAALAAVLGLAPLAIAPTAERPAAAASAGKPPPAARASAAPAAPAPTAKQQAAGAGSCLPLRRADLVQLIADQPLAQGSYRGPNKDPNRGPAQKPIRSQIPPPAPDPNPAPNLKLGDGQFVAVSRGAPRWLAGFNLALSWENDDCQAFANFAAQMGYEASEVIDEPTGEHHYVLTEKAGRHNGLFVFRAPAERARARPLTITAPHVGFDFHDARGIRLYRDVKAVAYLQNTAERCSSDACSGCTAFPSYACGGCPRQSDAAHSVDNLLFAVYAGLEAVRKDLRFEYHGAGPHAAVPGCRASAHMSQGSTRMLTAEQDSGTPVARFWQTLEQRIGPDCVCYHQRETGCRLPGTASVFGRLTNEEPTTPFDPCGQPSAKLSGRFLHFEWFQVPIEDIAAALAAAVPLPSRPTQ